MNKINTNLSGINRSVDDGISQDGQMAELINMRVKDGSLKPVGRPILLKQFAREPLYIHKNAGYEHYITRASNNLYYEYNKVGDDFVGVGYQIGSYSGDLVSIESVGNILVVMTTEDMYFYLYKSNSYSFIGTKPSLPVYYLTSQVSQLDEETDVAQPVRCTYKGHYTLTEGIPSEAFTSVKVDDKKPIKDAVDGLIAKAKYEEKQKGHIVDTIYIRYALRLFDGSLILHSPVFVAHGRDIVISTNVSGGKVYFEAWPFYDLPILRCRETEGIEDWKDFVTSVDFFAAESDYFEDECPKGLAEYIGDPSNLGNWRVNTANLSSAFEGIDGFHLIKSIAISDVATASVSIEELSKGIRLNLLQQELMEQDNLSQHTQLGEASYVYNGRLMIGDVIERLRQPFDARYYKSLYRSGSTEDMLCAGSVSCRLNTEQGEAIIRRQGDTVTLRGYQAVIISTDQRATSMTIAGKTLQLKRHPLLSLSYYQDSLLNPIFPETLDRTDSESNVYLRTSNKIKVSALNNPLVFPSKLTYTVSVGDVLAFRSVTTALSSGQFGQFPVYVFCDDGVYALEVGSGNIIYSRATPVTRDCLSHALASTDKSVVFATDESIIMLAGSSPVVISNDLSGYLPTFVDSPILRKAADVAGLTSSISQTEFRNYIKEANIGYSYEDKEIVIANPAFSYTYIYNMYSQSWHKTDVRIDSFINSYPGCFAIIKDGSSYGLFDMHNPKRAVNNVLMITKPIKFNTAAHKRVLQVALRGVSRPSESDVYLRGEHVHREDIPVQIFSRCGFYIFGSNDAEHFALISGREKIEDVRDLITKANKSKAYKYFVVVLAGGVRTDVSLNYIEWMAEATLENRLR